MEKYSGIDKDKISRNVSPRERSRLRSRGDSGTLSRKEIKSALDMYGFEESDFDTWAKDQEEKQLQGFEDMQVDPFEDNLLLLDRQIDGSNRKFYIVELSGNRFQIRAWSFL